MRKVLYVILDGLGDEPHPELDGRTPLETAATPNLDRLADRGRSGLVVTVGEGIAPESDIAVFAILGYDPRDHHSGRGPLEALGSGLDMRPGDLAYRVNFATVDPEWRILDRRVGRDLSSDEAAALAGEVNSGVALAGAAPVLRATVGHRGVLHIRRHEGRLSAEVTNTDPAYGREGALGVAKAAFDPVVQTCRPLPGQEGNEAAVAAAALTNDWIRQAHRILESSETNRRRRRAGSLAGNMILTRDAGDRLPEPPTFRERYGATWGCFVEMPVERGIATVLGMGEVPVPGPGPGGPGEQYATWAQTALEALEGYDGLYIHIKGPDIPAHDGLATEKRDIIAVIDEAFFGELLPALSREVIVAVTADHATSCVKKAHTDDPVPLVVAGGNVSADAVSVFSEAAAAKGSLGLLGGIEIMPHLLEAARA